MKAMGSLKTADILKGNRAAEIKRAAKSYGMELCALSNHADSFLIMGPSGKETDLYIKAFQRKKYGMAQRVLIRTAQAANVLEIPTVVGYQVLKTGDDFSFSLMEKDGRNMRTICGTFHTDSG